MGIGQLVKFTNFSQILLPITLRPEICLYLLKFYKLTADEDWQLGRKLQKSEWRHFSRCKSEKHYKQREKWRGHPFSPIKIFISGSCAIQMEEKVSLLRGPQKAQRSGVS